MKKILSYIFIIISLILLIFFGIRKNKNTSTLRDDKRDFSISDTLSIDKIIIENRSLEKLILQRNRQQTEWSLNDTLIANPYSINLLLKTIKEMQIKQPIARSALENVIKRMAIQNTKVDFFKNNKKIKTIYIGGETADQLGTFMMIEGATEPYIVHIPGFNGYLSSRFSCKEQLWRSKKIFPKQIKTVTYKKNNSKIGYSNSQKKIQNIYCEKFITNNKNLEKDIKSRTPFITIEISTETGSKEHLYCIRKKTVNKIKYKNQEYDEERFYGLINNTIMLIQYKQFKEIDLSDEVKKIFMPWYENQ
ncbi:MAG: hypothetical protein CMD23_00380 [Flavobacteriales bacterium]|nr:hypothetical protein [Flavobacteriales bacterium]|tara:strand:- start:1099 stop:2016 length:918 start_codon:yes stop_codon:yes gene_type:complete